MQPSPDQSRPDRGIAWVRRKLMLVLTILVAGMLAAICYHSYCGWVLHEGYPYNTFLFLDSILYTDFTDVLKSTQQSDPYAIWSLYLPFTYVAFRPLLSMSPDLARWLWFGVSGIVVAAFWFFQLRRSSRSSGLALAGTLAVLLSYPVLLAWNRGNIELGIFALCLGFLGCVRRGWHWPAVALIVPAICFKAYPAVYLVLWFRRRQWKHLVVALVLSSVVTMVSFSSFSLPAGTEYVHWKGQLAVFRAKYLVGNGAMDGSATAWNAAKAAYFFGTLERSELMSTPPPQRQEMRDTVAGMLPIYSLLNLVLLGAIVVLVVLVEREFWRRAVYLGIAITYSAPIGQDYKLLYLVGAVLCLVVVARKRKFDLTALILLALAVLPNRYLFLPYIITDSGNADCSAAILLTPLLVVIATALLAKDSLRWSTPSSRRRLASLAGWRRRASA